MVIEEPIDVVEDGKEDMEKRKPKPFRYVADENKVEDKLIMDEKTPFTVMKTRERPISFNIETPFLLGNVENAGKIEDIIKKHEEIRKLDEE